MKKYRKIHNLHIYLCVNYESIVYVIGDNLGYSNKFFYLFYICRKTVKRTQGLSRFAIDTNNINKLWSKRNFRLTSESTVE